VPGGVAQPIQHLDGLRLLLGPPRIVRQRVTGGAVDCGGHDFRFLIDSSCHEITINIP
jgi:hypothetical protein